MDANNLKTWVKHYLSKDVKKEVPQKKSFTSWLLGSKKDTLQKPQLEIMSEQEADAIDNEIESIPEYKPGTITLNLNLRIKEAIIDLGSESKRNTHMI